MHNQPTISPTCSPAVALPAQNVHITTPEADADGAAAFRAAIPVADGAVSPAATSPRQKTIGLPIKLHQLLKSAAEGSGVSRFTSTRISRARAKHKALIISGMLKGYGAHFDENGNYQWSKDPAHNRFERERAELNAEHFKALFTEYLASAVYGRVEQDPKLIPSPVSCRVGNQLRGLYGLPSGNRIG